MFGKNPEGEHKEEEKSKEINKEEAQAAIQKDRQERINKGGAEIELVLKKYNLSIDAIMISSRHGNVPQIKILAND